MYHLDGWYMDVMRVCARSFGQDAVHRVFRQPAGLPGAERKEGSLLASAEVAGTTQADRAGRDAWRRLFVRELPCRLSGLLRSG